MTSSQYYTYNRLSKEHTLPALVPSQRSEVGGPTLIIMSVCLIEKTGLNFVPLALFRSMLTDEIPTITRLCKLFRWLRAVEFSN